MKQPAEKRCVGEKGLSLHRGLVSGDVDLGLLSALIFLPPVAIKVYGQIHLQQTVAAFPLVFSVTQKSILRE